MMLPAFSFGFDQKSLKNTIKYGFSGNSLVSWTLQDLPFYFTDRKLSLERRYLCQILQNVSVQKAFVRLDSHLYYETKPLKI